MGMNAMNLRRIIIAISLIGFSLPVQAQSSMSKKERLNLFASLGYGIGVGSRYVGQSTTTNTSLTPGVVINAEDQYYNTGSGIKLDGGAALKLMERLDAEIAAEFTAGIGSPEVEVKETVAGLIASNTYSNSQLLFRLCIVPNFSFLDLVDVYIGVGLGPVLTFSSEEIKQTGVNTEVRDFDNGVTIAMLGKFGCYYPLNNFASLYGECGFEMMNVTQNGYTPRDTNGNQTGTKVEFVYDTYDQPNNNPVKTPGSNITIRFGARIRIL
jgi:hypothetical protein